MAMTVTDLPALLEGIPPGDWVAISESQLKVLAHGANSQTVEQEAKSMGEPLPLMVRVPEHHMATFMHHEA